MSFSLVKIIISSFCWLFRLLLVVPAWIFPLQGFPTLFYVRFPLFIFTFNNSSIFIRYYTFNGLCPSQSSLLTLSQASPFLSDYCVLLMSFPSMEIPFFCIFALKILSAFQKPGQIPIPKNNIDPEYFLSSLIFPVSIKHSNFYNVNIIQDTFLHIASLVFLLRLIFYWRNIQSSGLAISWLEHIAFLFTFLTEDS